MGVEFTLEGLTPKQMVLADIMWALDSGAQVKAFIKTLPKLEQSECLTIIELMKMAMVEQCSDETFELDQAQQVIDKVRK